MKLNEAKLANNNKNKVIYLIMTKSVYVEDKNFGYISRYTRISSINCFFKCFIFTGCGSTKLCFGSPDGCTKSKSCKAAVAVTVAGDKFDFELKAYQGAKWVGVGLSNDDKMGEDSVIECTKNGNSVGAFLSLTSGNPNYGATRTKNVSISL